MLSSCDMYITSADSWGSMVLRNIEANMNIILSIFMLSVTLPFPLMVRTDVFYRFITKQGSNEHILSFLRLFTCDQIFFLFVTTKCFCIIQLEILQFYFILFLQRTLHKRIMSELSCWIEVVLSCFFKVNWASHYVPTSGIRFYSVMFVKLCNYFI